MVFPHESDHSTGKYDVKPNHTFNSASTTLTHPHAFSGAFTKPVSCHVVVVRNVSSILLISRKTGLLTPMIALIHRLSPKLTSRDTRFKPRFFRRSLIYSPRCVRLALYCSFLFAARPLPVALPDRRRASPTTTATCVSRLASHGTRRSSTAAPGEAALYPCPAHSGTP